MRLEKVDNNDSILIQKCRYIDKVDDEIRKMLDEMVEFCRNNTRPKTLSLAANQVGINKRLIVIFDNEEVLQLANPQIIRKAGKQCFLEGCVNVGNENSFPGGVVERPAYVKIRAINYDGDLVEIDADGILAIMLCHEIDHLDGIMFTDKLIDELHSFKTPEERTSYRQKNPIQVIEPHNMNIELINKLKKLDIENNINER